MSTTRSGSKRSARAPARRNRSASRWASQRNSAARQMKARRAARGAARLMSACVASVARVERSETRGTPAPRAQRSRIMFGPAGAGPNPIRATPIEIILSALDSIPIGLYTRACPIRRGDANRLLRSCGSGRRPRAGRAGPHSGGVGTRPGNGHYEPAREELADVSGRNPRAKAPPDDRTNAGRRAVRRLLLRRADRRADAPPLRGERKREGVPRADMKNRGGEALASRAV